MKIALTLTAIASIAQIGSTRPVAATGMDHGDLIVRLEATDEIGLLAR
jgi:hypothetical protein